LVIYNNIACDYDPFGKNFKLDVYELNSMSSLKCLHESQLSISFRPVAESEQAKAIELWQTVFEPKGDDYFERYFLSTASPHYQEGDTLGAWSNDNLLVSVVHIRRSILRSVNNETFLCGIISNVTTLTEFRNQGLSRQLLKQAIEKMKREGFDLSMLGTGRSSHYLPLGFKPVKTRIQYVIKIPHDILSSNQEASWISASSISFYDQLLELYSIHPRSYQLDRSSPLMFEHWIGWHWQEDSAYIFILPNKRGYIAISQPDGKNSDVCVPEWRALDIDAETTLLNMAATEIHRRYRRNSFLLHTLPQYTTLKELGWNSDKLIFEQNEDIMIRNIRLPNDKFLEIKMAYETEDGNATFWPGEYF
jgi:predicted acetyltransferase